MFKNNSNIFFTKNVNTKMKVNNYEYGFICGAAKFVNFTNSKGESFVANSDGTKFGTIVNNNFVPYRIFTSDVPSDPYNIPLTLEAMEAGAVITFDNKATGPVTYKVNGGEVQTIASGATGTITLENIGDKVEFFGDNKAYATSSYINCSNIYCYKDCYVYGNIMSLVKSEGFENATTLENGYTFASFFRTNEHIKNKSGADLLLPATTLAVSCYNLMFSGCSSLASITCLATNISASDCTTDWLSGVAASGAFTKAAGMTGWTRDASGIPSGWTVQDYNPSGN